MKLSTLFLIMTYMSSNKSTGEAGRINPDNRDLLDHDVANELLIDHISLQKRG